MIQDYDAAITYLQRLIATPMRHAQGTSLQRAGLLLAHADDPQQRFATLHVTGSSGKGSTATLAAGIVRAAGYRTGLFTSPHLVDYTERIAVDGVPIDRADWARLLRQLAPAVESMAGNRLPGYTLGRPAFLEVLWALAALYFAEQGVDVAVVEVGLGGRYDPTTVNNARVGVITNVSLEHTRRLGATVAEIAYHKAGVAKPGGIVVTAADDPAALEVIAAECASQGTTLWRVTAGDGDVRGDGSDVHYASDGGDGGDGRSMRVTTPLRAHASLRLGMLGRYQQTNAACAVAAVDALVALDVIAVDEDAVRRGVAATRVPGRLEQVARDPLTLLDGAHNPAAARALAGALRDLFPGRPPVLLLGILGDKDGDAMVAALAPLARAVVVTEPPWPERLGAGPAVTRAAQHYLRDVTFVPDVPSALSRAQERARALDAPLVVTGSLILVGAVRRVVRGTW